MSSALGEPPDSGVKGSASAAGAAIRDARSAAARAAKSRRRGMPEGKARGSYLQVPPRLHLVADASAGVSGPFERGLALLHDREDALLEVARPGEGMLQLGLEV